MKRYRTLLADDHEVVRSGIRNGLRAVLDIEIVGEVGSGSELMTSLAALRPIEFLLIDVAMPEFEPISDIQEIRARYPDLKILVVSAHDDDVYVQGLLGAGVNGYHMKDQPLNDLRLAVQRVLGGQKWVTGRLLDKLVTSVADPDRTVQSLTRRQREILKLLKEGNDNQTIARLCSLSVKTVENHLTRIYRQLGVQSRLEAVNFLSNHPNLLNDPSAPRQEVVAPSVILGDEFVLEPTVLLVDDNARYRQMLRRTFSGFVSDQNLYEADGREAALKIAKRQTPHFAFVDVVLGNESGIECVRDLVGLPQAPRIILITAYPDREFHRSGLEAGATALIDKKDLSLEVLRQIVADF